MGGLIAVFSGIYQFGQNNLQSANGQSVRVNAELVYTALRKEVSDDTDRFIIDRLDRTFFLVSQLEIAVRSELVNMEDVRYPLSGYAAEKMCPHQQLFESYMRDYAAPETLSFFERLEKWRSCQS